MYELSGSVLSICLSVLLLHHRDSHHMVLWLFAFVWWYKRQLLNTCTLIIWTKYIDVLVFIVCAYDGVCVHVHVCVCVCGRVCMRTLFFIPLG